MKIVFYEKEKHEKELKLLHLEKDFRRFLCVNGGQLIEPKEGGLYYVNLVAVNDNNEFMGFSFTSLHSDSACCKQLYIKKEFRQTGIAKSLLEKTEDIIKDGFTIPMIYALTVENEEMEKVFLNNGYENKGTYYNFNYSGGEFRDQSIFIKRI